MLHKKCQPPKWRKKEPAQNQIKMAALARSYSTKFIIHGLHLFYKPLWRMFRKFQMDSHKNRPVCQFASQGGCFFVTIVLKRISLSAARTWSVLPHPERHRFHPDSSPKRCCKLHPLHFQPKDTALTALHRQH